MFCSGLHDKLLPKKRIIICIRTIPDNEDKPRELSGDDAVNILLVVLAANK